MTEFILHLHAVLRSSTGGLQVLVFPDGHGGVYFSTLNHVAFVEKCGRTTLVAWRRAVEIEQ